MLDNMISLVCFLIAAIVVGGMVQGIILLIERRNVK